MSRRSLKAIWFALACFWLRLTAKWTGCAFVLRSLSSLSWLDWLRILFLLSDFSPVIRSLLSFRSTKTRHSWEASISKEIISLRIIDYASGTAFVRALGRLYTDAWSIHRQHSRSLAGKMTRASKHQLSTHLNTFECFLTDYFPLTWHLQLISNKFISVEHRVVAKNAEPRVSIACFFSTHFHPASTRMYGPIKELLSENPSFV